MILLLNVSVEPFFIALVKEDGALFSHALIPNNKQAGEELFAFCEKHNEHFSSLSWSGSVTGPGGFATLRLAASLINSLSYVHSTSIRALSAFEWVSIWLKETNYEQAILNSFGGKVFLVAKDGSHSLIALEEVVGQKNTWYGSLPDAKIQKLGLNRQKEGLDMESLYKICIQKKEVPEYIPDYCFEAVQENS